MQCDTADIGKDENPAYSDSAGCTRGGSYELRRSHDQGYRDVCGGEAGPAGEIGIAFKSVRGGRTHIVPPNPAVLLLLESV